MGDAITRGGFWSGVSDSISRIADGVTQAGASAVAEIVASRRTVHELATPSARDAQMIERRRLIGNTQSDSVLDPSILVIRQIGVDVKENAYKKFRNVWIFENESLQAQVVKQFGADILFATDRFILQQASESDEEKLGPIYTFGIPKLYCGGRSPRTYTYGGHLVDTTRDGSGKAFWFTAYNEYLRGSKCVQNNAFAELYYRDQIRRGYLLHTNLTESSQQPDRAQFAFSMHVIAEFTTANLALVNIPEVPDFG